MYIGIPFDLRDIHPVDMFPDWEEGLRKILKSMNVDEEQVVLVIQHQRTNSPFTLSDVSPLDVLQIHIFKGEKQFFVGRQNYINQIIKDKLRVQNKPKVVELTDNACRKIYKQFTEERANSY